MKSKKSRYKIRDPFITLWMRFVYRQLSLYEAGNYRYFLDKLDTSLSAFMGLAFEGIIKELCQALNQRGEAPIAFHRLGRWWHRGMELDLVGLNDETNAALVVECKWTSRPIDIDVFRELERKAKSLPLEPAHCCYVLASKSGFSPRLRRQQGSQLHLWDMPTIATLIQQLIRQ